MKPETLNIKIEQVPPPVCQTSVVKCQLSSQGLTLIELLISLSVGSVILILLLNTFTTLIKTQRQLLAFNQLQTSTTRILTQLQTDIRWGQSVLEPVDSTPTDRLVIKTDEGTVTYTWNAGTQTLSRQVDSGPLSSLHPNHTLIKEFQISQLTAADSRRLPLIDISITATPFSPQLKFLVLEKHISYTNKKILYEL